jgi:ElaB/YqjD/DUF883 family membrane-anchored ribosome-binding protein
MLVSERTTATLSVSARTSVTQFIMETHFPNMENSQSRLARERVMADLKTLASDAEDLLKATAGDVSDKARDARTRVSAALDRARTTYADLQEHGIESARAAVKQADETIRSHPYESVGIAFGLGILLGAVLRRK